VGEGKRGEGKIGEEGGSCGVAGLVAVSLKRKCAPAPLCLSLHPRAIALLYHCNFVPLHLTVSLYS
jgi:hypothetical protein